MRNFAIAATIVLTLAAAAVWAQPTATSGASMAASGEIDVFALQVNARNLPVPVVQDLN